MASWKDNYFSAKECPEVLQAEFEEYPAEGLMEWVPLEKGVLPVARAFGGRGAGGPCRRRPARTPSASYMMAHAGSAPIVASGSVNGAHVGGRRRAGQARPG